MCMGMCVKKGGLVLGYVGICVRLRRRVWGGDFQEHTLGITKGRGKIRGGGSP